MSQVLLREATASDAAHVLTLIRELATYERLAHEVEAREDDLRRHLLTGGDDRGALLLFEGAEAVGFAVWYRTFSTFVGRPGLWLEDLFVRPAYRGRGYGKRLLVELARRAQARDYGRFEWTVLNWNEPALEFYRRLGARPMSEWTVHRLAGEALRRVGEDEGGAP